MSDFTNMTLEGALAGLKAKDFTSLEITEAHIKACEEASELNVFITTDFDNARVAAKASDAKLAKGEGGLLEGAPLGVKDLFCTEGVRTTAGSKLSLIHI